MEDESRRVKVASVFSSMHTSVVVASAKMLVELKRYNYVTPTNFLELVKVTPETGDTVYKPTPLALCISPRGGGSIRDLG